MNGVYLSCDLNLVGDGLRVWKGLADVPYVTDGPRVRKGLAVSMLWMGRKWKWSWLTTSQVHGPTLLIRVGWWSCVAVHTHRKCQIGITRQYIVWHDPYIIQGHFLIRFWIWCHLRWMWSVTCAISKMEQYQEERVRWPGSNGTNYISSDAKWLRGGEIEEGISISDQSVLLKPLRWLFPKREGLKPNLNMMNGTSPGPVFCVDSGSEVGILIFHLCEVLHPYLYLKCTTRNWSSNSKCFNQ